MAMICLLKIALLLHPFAKSAKEWVTRVWGAGQVVIRLVQRFVGKPAEIQLAAIGAADWEDVLLKG